MEDIHLYMTLLQTSLDAVEVVGIKVKSRSCLSSLVVMGNKEKECTSG